MPQRVLTEAEFTAIKQALLRQAPDGLDEANFQRWFKPRFDGAIAEAENSREPVSGGSLRRFIGNAASILNPITIGEGVYEAVRHPIDTGESIVNAHATQAGKARQALSEGRYSEAVGHGMATVLPVVGPLAADIGEQAGSGDVAGGLGRTAGLLTPFAVGGAVRARIGQRARRGDPARLERAAAEQVSQRVLAPGNVKFKGKAEAVAPEILRRGMRGGREDLAQLADEGMATSGQQIDTAIAAGGGGQSGVVIDPIVRQLQQRIDDLTVNGEPIAGAGGRVTALQARIAQLERTAKVQRTPPGLVQTGRGPKPLRALSFDDLRKIRDEQYRIAEEGRAYARMGNPALSDEAFAAAEEGGAIRSEFGRLSPDLKQANADFSFFKTLGDVLDPAQGRPKATAPPSGVTGGATVSGAVAGTLIGPKTAFALTVVRPWIQRVRSAPAWQLADAHSKMQLAEAIRQGNVPLAQKLMVRIGEGAVATNPSESRTRTTAPAWSTP